MKNLLKLVAIAGLVSAAAVNADEANAQKALQKAQFMLRQATSEKAELQTQVDALKQQVDKLTHELAESKTDADSSKQKIQKEYGGAIESWKQNNAKLSDELGTMKQQLAQQVAQRKETETQLQRQSNNFSLCYDNNKKLYDINTELLARYENKSFGDVLKQKEPFTGIKQVDVENLVQDYRYQIDDLKVKQAQSAVSNEGAK